MRCTGGGTAAVPDVSQHAARYRLRQVFRYDYDGPATDLVHRLVVVPPARHGDQRLVLGALRVSSEHASVAWTTSPDGARVAVVRLADVPRRLTMSVDVVVDRGGAVARPDPGLLGSPRLRGPSALTRPDAALARVARRAAGGDPLATAEALCTAVHRRIAYERGATTVRTTAAQAWALGAGVCQDQAHALLALCRRAGIASRYVSGHLVGQGGTHAWVEVLVPDGADARAVALDPCHDRRAGEGYVTVAVGRDYADVPPTSGWYSGRAVGTLSTERELAVVR